MNTGFERRKEQSKEEIRRAASELFGQFGVEKVSMADIARKAGVSQATIYNNFGSKEALAREFATSLIQQMTNRFEAVLSPHQMFWQKMAAFIEFISAMLAEGRPSEVDARVLGNQDLINDPEVKRMRHSAQEKMTDLLLGLVREGKEQGEVPADLSEAAFRLYFKAFIDIFSDRQFRPLLYDDPKLVHDLGSLMIYGLSGPGGKTRATTANAAEPLPHDPPISRRPSRRRAQLPQGHSR